MKKNINTKDKWIIGLLVSLIIISICGVLFGVAYNQPNLILCIIIAVAVILGMGFTIHTFVQTNKIRKFQKKKAAEKIKNLHRKERVSLDNKAIFKAKDLKLLNEVISFLKGMGLEPEIDKSFRAKLRGGLKKQMEKEFLRIYRDIDLAVPSNSIKEGTIASRRYIAIIQELGSAAEEKSILLRHWNIKDETDYFSSYVGLEVECKFVISYSQKDEPSTLIDLTFGKHSEGFANLMKEDGFFNIGLPSTIKYKLGDWRCR